MIKVVDEGRSDEGGPSIRSIPSFLCLPQPLSPQPPLHTYRIFPLAVTRISNLRQDNHLESETFSPQNLPICAAMDPSDDVPPHPKKHCSDDRKATYTNNFAKRHRKKGRGRSRDTSLSRHTRGSKMKKSSYDFVGVGESLGTGPDPQSIKSELMPDNVLPQRKLTGTGKSLGTGPNSQSIKSNLMRRGRLLSSVSRSCPCALPRRMTKKRRTRKS